MPSRTMRPTIDYSYIASLPLQTVNLKTILHSACMGHGSKHAYCSNYHNNYSRSSIRQIDNHKVVYKSSCLFVNRTNINMHVR